MVSVNKTTRPCSALWSARDAWDGDKGTTRERQWERRTPEEVNAESPGASGAMEAGGRDAQRRKCQPSHPGKKSRQKGERLNMKMHLVDFSMNGSQQQRPQMVHSLRGSQALAGGFPCLRYHLSEVKRTGFP